MECKDVDKPQVEHKTETKCETVYNKECKMEYSTVYDDVTKQKCTDVTNDVCTDVVNNVCTTVHDTVTKKDCKLEEEEQC